MNTEDYCSYELSRKLKEAGFDWPTYSYYTVGIHKCTTSGIEDCPVDYNTELDSFISRPTLYQAQKWLREKFNIGIYPYDTNCNVSEIDMRGNFVVMANVQTIKNDLKDLRFHSYEAALEAGINAAVETIVERGKE